MGSKVVLRKLLATKTAQSIQSKLDGSSAVSAAEQHVHGLQVGQQRIPCLTYYVGAGRSEAIL